MLGDEACCLIGIRYRAGKSRPAKKQSTQCFAAGVKYGAHYFTDLFLVLLAFYAACSGGATMSGTTPPYSNQ